MSKLVNPRCLRARDGAGGRALNIPSSIALNNQWSPLPQPPHHPQGLLRPIAEALPNGSAATRSLLQPSLCESCSHSLHCSRRSDYNIPEQAITQPICLPWSRMPDLRPRPTNLMGGSHAPFAMHQVLLESMRTSRLRKTCSELVVFQNSGQIRPKLPSLPNLGRVWPECGRNKSKSAEFEPNAPQFGRNLGRVRAVKGRYCQVMTRFGP